MRMEARIPSPFMWSINNQVAVGILVVGFYRDVKLSVTDKVHLAQYGTTITTPQLEKQQNGAVDTVVKSRIVNQDDQAS